MTQPPIPPAGSQGGYPDPAQQPPPPAQPGTPYQGPPQGQAPQGQPYQQPQGQQFPPPGPQNQPYQQQFQAPQTQPGGSTMSFDPKSVSNGDWTVLGVGVLMLIFSFFGWLTYGGIISTGGWNGWWVLIQLIMLAVLVIKAIQVFTGNLKKEIPGIALVGAGAVIVVLTLIALIQAFTQPLGIGPGFGIWAYFILSIGLTYLLALDVQKEGGKLPFKVPGPAGF
jgi:hypothetical protein